MFLHFVKLNYFDTVKPLNVITFNQCQSDDITLMITITYYFYVQCTIMVNK